MNKLCGVRLTGQPDIKVPLKNLELTCGEKLHFPKLQQYLNKEKASAKQYSISMKALTSNTASNNIIKDIETGTPFMAEQKIGKGRVVLFNLADFSDNSKRI